MKINTKALLDTSGFACISMAYDQEAEGYVECEARAVFITEETVSRARVAQASMPASDPSRFPDIRYGDILVSRKRMDQKKEGLHVPAGCDAGLIVPVISSDGFETNIPFTGGHMLAARQKLLAMSARGRTLSASHGAILSGIQGVLEVIAARPDIKRFSEDLIGKAFMCSLIDHAGKIEMSISDAEFGRKARADMIRAKITRLSPDHPDGLSARAAATLDEVLQDVGINLGGRGNGAHHDVGGVRINEETMRGMISSNPTLCRDVFGAITATPISQLSAAVITCGEYELLADELSDNVLSGAWINRTARRAREITGAQHPNYEFEMLIVSIDGIDIMAIRDSVGAATGQAFIYAWPSSDRIPLAEINSQTVLNISPEEVPGEIEIARLGSVLDAMISDKALDGADQQGRVVRMA
ncbi:hypothetical protein KUV57_12995 [Epibacterium sp. DP7N7-1]|nr:hypothetical protein [Epibacterium sp. DP7N7-1]